MAKEKGKKGAPNKHLHARVAYLHQAANYLNSQSPNRPENDEVKQDAPESVAQNDLKETRNNGTTPASGNVGTNSWHSQANSRSSTEGPGSSTFNQPKSGLPLQLNAHLRAVAQKAQIRLSREIKHAICKICSSPLIDGETCIRSTENSSKGGRKPWADILVLKCCACGACKRFPVGATKQKRKALRAENGLDSKGEEACNAEKVIAKDSESGKMAAQNEFKA